jgi:hypothetical protein
MNQAPSGQKKVWDLKGGNKVKAESRKIALAEALKKGGKE